MQAGVASKAIQETLEVVAKKFGKEAVEEGAEKLTAKLVRLGSRYGDDIVGAAVKKVGPRAARLAGDAGEHADVALRLLGRFGDDAAPLVTRAASLKAVARFGDDAAAALLKHGTVGEEVVERFAKEGVEALAKVTPQNGRRLAMLAKEGALEPELVSVVARWGDAGCDFIWRNKGALAVGTTLATFLASPGEFLDGTRSLTEGVGQALIQPLAEAAIQPLAEVPGAIARNTDWMLLSIVTVIATGLAAGVWGWKTRSVVRVVKAVTQARRERKPN
ncbi:MAG TPA: hypothetical protein VG826_33035 [Pirellulales bacterium]|nr:hypothetical protein [Pirellulales bacterium]